MHPETHAEYALARKKVKTDKGKIEYIFDATVSLEDDLKERDFTINAMAKDPETGIIVDPFNGQEDLKQKVLNGDLRTNKEVFDYTLEQGHIPQHASDKLKEMKKGNLIEYDAQTPLVNYNKVYKEKRIVSYKITKQ